MISGMQGTACVFGKWVEISTSHMTPPCTATFPKSRVIKLPLSKFRAASHFISKTSQTEAWSHIPRTVQSPPGHAIDPWDIWIPFYRSNSSTSFSDWWLRYLMWNCPQTNVTETYWWLVNTDSDNGLVSLVKKPLPDPMLTRVYDVKRHH